jgi:hypothetical protein
MIQPGTQDPAKVAAMTGPELLAEEPTQMLTELSQMV